MNKGLSVNRLAWKLLDELIADSEVYGVRVEKTRSGTTLVDAGIEANGGFAAGQLVTEICMGGCGRTAVTWRRYGEIDLPSISVQSDHPVIATLGSQYAGWQINDEGYFAIGSGPARALALKPKNIYREIGYKDDFDRAIVVLETDRTPPEKLIERFAGDCNVEFENLAIILTPTTSLVGATQISGRIVETGIHKLRKLGLDMTTILYAYGIAPIPPLHPKFREAMARTNDTILYGGSAHYVVDYEREEELVGILEKAPSKASKDYGRPFIEIFRDAGYDFYKIDPNLFAPAIVTINNVRSGKIMKAGEIDADTLAKSMGF